MRWSKPSTVGTDYAFDDSSTIDLDGYFYNAAGKLTRMWYPSGRSANYEYDAVGRPKAVKGFYNGNGYDYISAIDYHPHGAPFHTTLANGIVESVSYNERLQPTVMESAKSGSLWKLTNFYCVSEAPSCNGASGNNGNVISQKLEAPKTAGGVLVLATTYGYDTVNRCYRPKRT